MSYLDETGLAHFWDNIRQWIASAASNLVHRTGDESIQGYKTFKENATDHKAVINLQCDSFKREDIPQDASHYCSVVALASDDSDSGGPVVGAVQFAVRDSGARDAQIFVYDRVAGQPSGFEPSGFVCGYDQNGIAFSCAASTSPSRSYGRDIVTRDWIPNDTRIVHTTGNESISGTKTFENASTWATNSPALSFVHKQLDDIVNAPSATMSWVLHFRDKNDTDFGRLRYEFLTSGMRNVLLGVVDGSGTYSQIAVGYDSNGIAYAMAPATSTTRTGSTDIVTRGFLADSASNLVHRTGNETVGGTKTFSAPIVSAYASPAFAFSNNTSAVNFCGGTSTSYTTGAKIILYGGSASSSAGCFDCSTGGSSRRSLIGNPSGTLMWNGQTVQTSSDERVKDFISSVPDGDLDSWGAVEWVRFKYRADVEAKGADACRWHTGLVSQHVERACASGPMDVLSYGMLCLDSVENEDTGKRDELWMVRYAEALCMEAAYMRRENARLKKRVADLEERLAALELKIA